MVNKHKGDGSDDERTPCKWGISCHDHNTAHRTQFSHPVDTKPHHPTDNDKIPCKWGTKCHDFDAVHRANFFHSKT